MPNREPKFHKYVIVLGVGRSTKLEFIMLKKPFFFLIGILLYIILRT